MLLRSTILLALLASAALPTAAIAQSVPVTISFNGQVANDPAASIMLRSYDPASGYTLTPYSGPLPDYSYHAGDTVTFTVSTFMPSAADLASGRYDNALQPDGTYRIGLIGPNNAGTSTGVGVVRNLDVSGPIGMTLNSGQPLGGGGLAVVINPVDYSYSLATENGWSFATFDAPGFTYDPVSGSLSPASTTCAGIGGCAQNGDGGFALAGDLDSISTGNMPIYGTDRGLYGFFSMLFSGSWSLPSYSAGGGSTQVPEPGMMLLFGAGAAAVMRRQRKRAKA